MGRNCKALKKKTAILIILSILFVGQLIIQTLQRNKERKIYLEEMERMKNQEAQQVVSLIENLDEYAADVMGDNTYLLDKSLREWTIEKNITVAAAKIIYVDVPENQPESIYFFVQLMDEEETRVLLIYHSRENVVKTNICTYTQEEILSEVWEDNGPQNRDVSEEMENEFLSNQEEADGINREN